MESVGNSKSTGYYGEQFSAALSDDAQNLCSPYDKAEVDTALANGSLCSFNKDPIAFLERMNKTVENSQNYELCKSSLFKAMQSQSLSPALLAYIMSFVKDTDIKEIALRKFEKVISENNPTCGKQAIIGLFDAANYIEVSLPSVTDSQFLTKQLSVYGDLLTCILLHVWEDHICLLSAWLRELREKIVPFLKGIKQRRGAANKEQKYGISFCLFIIRSLMYAGEEKSEMQNLWEILRKLVFSDNSNLHSDINWEEILGVKHMEKDPEAWFYFMKVVLQACTGDQLKQRELSCLPLHALTFMVKKFKSDSLYQEGTILHFARVLTRMVCQARNESKVASMVVFGCTEVSFPGHGMKYLLDTICQKGSKSFQKSLCEVIRPILSASNDLNNTSGENIRRVLLERMVPDPSSTVEMKRVLMRSTIDNLLEHSHIVSQNLSIDPEAHLNQADNDVFYLDGKLNGKPITCVVLDEFNFRCVGQIKKNERIIRKLRHKNIPKLLKSGMDRAPTHFITERFEGEDLQSFLLQRRHNPGSFPLYERVKLAAKLCEIEHYMVHSGLLLRNLNGNTIKMAEEGNHYVPKIVNFQQALMIQGENFPPGTMRDPIDVRSTAPEAFLDNLFSEKSEVYTFGCLLFMIFTLGSPAFQELLKPEDVQVMVCAIDYKVKKPKCVPSDVFNLILSCLDQSPEQRPVFGHVRSRLQNILNRVKAQKHNEDEEPSNAFPRKPTPGDFRKRTEGCVKGVRQGIEEMKEFTKGNFSESKKVVRFPTSQQALDKCKRCKQRGNCFTGHNPADLALVKTWRSLVSIGYENRNLAAISFPSDKDALHVKISTRGTTDILTYIHDNQVENRQIIMWILDIGRALDCLLGKGIILWDVQPNCIIMEKQENQVVPKITNFERCKELPKGTDPATCVSYPGVVPACFETYPIEILLDLEHPYITSKTPSYLLAMLCWKLLTELSPNKRSWPFGCVHVDEIVDLLLKKVTPEKPKCCPDWLYLWMKIAWRDLAERPTIKTLVTYLASRIEDETSRRDAAHCKNDLSEDTEDPLENYSPWGNRETEDARVREKAHCSEQWRPLTYVYVDCDAGTSDYSICNNQTIDKSTVDGLHSFLHSEHSTSDACSDDDIKMHHNKNNGSKASDPIIDETCVASHVMTLQKLEVTYEDVIEHSIQNDYFFANNHCLKLTEKTESDSHDISLDADARKSTYVKTGDEHESYQKDDLHASISRLKLPEVVQNAYDDGSSCPKMDSCPNPKPRTISPCEYFPETEKSVQVTLYANDWMDSGASAQTENITSAINMTNVSNRNEETSSEQTTANVYENQENLYNTLADYETLNAVYEKMWSNEDENNYEDLILYSDEEDDTYETVDSNSNMQSRAYSGLPNAPEENGHLQFGRHTEEEDSHYDMPVLLRRDATRCPVRRKHVGPQDKT